ncbi:MAG TPA: retropepsin-like aspartic protease [Rhizomicrobium sp.]|jgi:hypothetical protein
MKRLVSLAAAATVAACAAAHADSAPDCTLKEFASLDIAFDGGAMTVPVKIANADRRMMIDLAVPDTGVRESLANELQLRQLDLPGGIAGVTYAGDKVAKQVVLPDFQIGRIKVENAKVLMFGGNKLPPDVVGILGTGLFDKLDAEIDFKKAKLNLFSPDHCEGNVVYWTDTFASFPFRLGAIHQTYLRAEMDGKTVKTSFATTDEHSSMMLSAAKQLFDLTPDSPGMTVAARNTDGTPSVYRYPFKQMLFGGVAINNPAIDIVVDTGPRCNGTVILDRGDFKTCYGAVDVYLGFNVLRKLHLYIASDERTLYITAADASAPPVPAPSKTP